METKSIDKKCSLCGEEAVGVIKKGNNTLELCHDCAKDILWHLIHDKYNFDAEEE